MMTIGHQKAKGEFIMIKNTSVLVKNKSLDAQCPVTPFTHLRNPRRQFASCASAEDKDFERREGDNFMRHCDRFGEYENPCNGEDRGFGCF